MRPIMSTLFAAALLPSSAYALGELTSFERVQTECVPAAGVAFGTGTRWPACRVDKGRWFSTIGLTDLYQAQYCLGQGGETCDARALVLFANRAYTPVARALFVQVDPGDTEYADPQVLATPHGEVLRISSRRAGGEPADRYYLWRQERWQAIDADSWRADLLRRLPPGHRPSGPLHPDFESMSAEGGIATRSGKRHASISLGLEEARLVVKSVSLAVATGD